MKPKYVYHGSPNALVGNFLQPRKATDLGNRSENIHTGVYATDIINHARIVAILSSKGVNSSSLSLNDPKSLGIIYDGWPEQKEVFVHTLPINTFQKTGVKSHQWISLVSVKPVKTEKINVSDYLHLVRKATDEEKKKWNEKYKNKLNS